MSSDLDDASTDAETAPAPGSDLDYDAPALDDAPTEKNSDEPDALDHLLDDLENNPEPEGDDI